MHELALRVVQRSDLPDIISLYAQPDMDGDAVLSLDKAERLYARIQRYPDYELYIAEREGRTVGSYALLIMDNLGHGGTPSAVIEDVVVEPASQSQGIGRAMMQHAIEIARGRGCYKIVLSSNLAREAAHAFYESLDFEKHGYSYRIRFDGDPKEGQ
ncbi:GNAT family N-acetyltransferase [Salinisphaera sp. SPP-AMP-43]|uniref:GNAT family N-acetyltransferase n=1 Tax=Salinisphaera sp. SPP-AMP-43 TaxID=3121288 RepID=UPI003C6E2AEB